MRFRASFLLLLLLGGLTALAAGPSFKFRGVEFTHRWSKGDQHEFTPAGQEDLKKWTDMMTLITYPDVKDGEGLARVANNVLGAYQGAQAKVMGTNSVPAAAGKPAQHFIAVYFPQPDFIEAVFTRLYLRDGKTGAALVYSRRVYGPKKDDEMNTWLRANGAAVEKDLMALGAVPNLPAKP